MAKGKKQLPKDEKNKLKQQYIKQFINYIEKYDRIIVVNADNVRSKQMADIRTALRNKAEILMGKNTMMRKSLKVLLENEDGAYDALQEKAQAVSKLEKHIRGNVGLMFTNEDLVEIRDIVRNYKVGAPAKQGAIAPLRVVVPAGNTGCEPTKTGFFQALNITTKITRGTVEITKDHLLMEPGDKVGNSEATLLNMLDIKPFEYGLDPEIIYDKGAMYTPNVLDLTDEMMEEKVRDAGNQIASIGLQLGIPNEASIPHSIANSFKSLLAVAANTEYSFTQAEKVKEFLADPSKFATATTTESKKEEPEPEPEEEEESEGDAFGGLF